MILVSSTRVAVPMRVPVDPLVEEPLVPDGHRAAGVQHPRVLLAGGVQVVEERQGVELWQDRETQLGEHSHSSPCGRPVIVTG